MKRKLTYIAAMLAITLIAFAVWNWSFRIAGFLVRLAEVEGLDPNKVVEDARQILADAEIAQEG